MPELKDIPLNEIVKDWRVKEYVRKEGMRLAKINIAKFKNNQRQVLSCHAWLLCIHYEAITRLQEKYQISKPEFMVLMGAYLFARKGLNGFKALELSSTLLSWQHTRIYRHLKNLSHKGYVRIERNPYNGIHRYFLTFDGRRVIRAFSQHYYQVYDEVWEKMGDLPGSFSSGFY
jgi:DNA-binding MarR family transcriptional regulator